MNTIREIEKINQEELDRGIAGTSASWHAQYSKSAWVYVGNLDHELTEGDILCVVSQYGEVEDIHLAREEDTGKSRGFAFVKYEDARSCVLAVDNFVGVQLLGRSLRVDHVEKYRLPKKLLEAEEGEESAPDLGAGHAYKDAELSNEYNILQGQDVFAPVNQSNPAKDPSTEERRRKRKETHRKRKHSRRKDDSRKGSKRDRRHDETDSEDDRKKRSRSEKKRKHRSRNEDSAIESER